jgi:hypothetical protein
MKQFIKFISAVVTVALLYSALSFLRVIAFNGPTQSPPGGSGAVVVSTSSLLSVGTSTPATDSELLIVGSTTVAGSYGLKILDANGNPLFRVQNDGTIYLGTSTFSGGTYTGTISAGNVSAGQFGSGAGGGNFSFPANLGAVTLSVGTSSVTESSTFNGNEIDNGQYYSNYYKNANGTTAINWNNGNVQSVVLTVATTTFTFSNTKAGGRYILAVIQDSTGNRNVVWPTAIQWPGSTAPTLSTTTNKMDLVTFVCMGISSNDCYGGANLNYAQ